MPVNMPTHGHGQGYADINFTDPGTDPVGERPQGAVLRRRRRLRLRRALSHIDYMNRLPKNILETTNGTFGYHRGLAAGSASVGAGTLLAAVEGVKYNGPWDMPDNVRKFNGVLRYSQGTATDGFTLSAMAYSNAWNSTDQVAQRAIDQGVIGRFGSLDPTDGGVSTPTFTVGQFCAFERRTGRPKSNAYVVNTAMRLYNNFTYFLDDPVNGDQFSQMDRRTTYGLNASHAFDARIGGIETADPRRPADRGDDIRVGLFKTLQRETLPTVREDSVREGSVGLWADTTARWTDWLRTDRRHPRGLFRGRGDQRHAGQFRQRAGVDDEPQGRHRARAVVQDRVLRQRRLRPALQRHPRRDHHGRSDRQGDAHRIACRCWCDRKAPRSASAPSAIEGLTSSLAVFVLDFDSELLFVGDAGTTEAEPAEPARRRGVDQPVSGAAVDAARSRCSLYTRPLYRFRSGRRFHSRCAGMESVGRRRHVRRRDRLVRRAAWTLFRPASADRGRQRSFAGVADLQCARRLSDSTTAAACSSTCSTCSTRRPTRSNITICRGCRANRSAASPTATCIRRSRWPCG